MIVDDIKYCVFPLNIIFYWQRFANLASTMDNRCRGKYGCHYVIRIELARSGNKRLSSRRNHSGE